MANVYKKIFAALDGSEMQVEVARKAMVLAAENEAELCFGHVVDAVPVEATGIDMGELCREVQERFESQLADVLEEARSNPSIPRVTVKVDAGQITDTLHHKLIEPYGADLVLCGERGLSKVAYVFVGSVSTYLIRNLRCDVLVVKAGE